MRSWKLASLLPPESLGGGGRREQPAQPAAGEAYANMSKSQRKRMNKLDELREKKKHRSATLATIGCVVRIERHAREAARAMHSVLLVRARCERGRHTFGAVEGEALGRFHSVQQQPQFTQWSCWVTLTAYRVSGAACLVELPPRGARYPAVLCFCGDVRQPRHFPSRGDGQAYDADAEHGAAALGAWVQAARADGGAESADAVVVGAREEGDQKTGAETRAAAGAGRCVFVAG